MLPPAQLTPAQHQAVVSELNRILADPAFSGSKRCVAFFTYLVKGALKGDLKDVKERTLGIEAFGRDPSYDPQADPIVRMTANEIRKRLGQCYYEEQGSHHNVKIRLNRGSYIPEFDFGGGPSIDPIEAEPQDAPLEGSVSPVAAALAIRAERRLFRRILKRRRILWIGSLGLAFAAGALLHRVNFASSQQDRFWEPLLHNDQPLMICMPDDSAQLDMEGVARGLGTSDSGSAHQNVLASGSGSSIPLTPYVDANTAIDITNWLTVHGRKVLLRRPSQATIRQFSHGGVALIGGFDNPWSQVLLSNLRFRLRADPLTHEKWIEDAQNPARRDWSLKAGGHFEDSFVDYALISRFWDSKTENWLVAVSGLGPLGSRAAAELITDSAYDRSLPSGVNARMNLQIVVQTSAIKGASSPPQVLAFHSW